MIVVVSSDPADAGRVQLALGLLDRSMRLSGRRLPTSLDGPVVHALPASGGQEVTTVADSLEDLDDAVVKLLTAADVALRLNCSERTVRRFIASGELPTRRLGRRRYVLPEDLDRFVAGLPADTASHPSDAA